MRRGRSGKGGQALPPARGQARGGSSWEAAVQAYPGAEAGTGSQGSAPAPLVGGGRPLRPPPRLSIPVPRHPSPSPGTAATGNSFPQRRGTAILAPASKAGSDWAAAARGFLGVVVSGGMRPRRGRANAGRVCKHGRAKG